MINKTINGYTILSKLGEGGMADVWYAENTIGKKAAIKFLKKELSFNEKIVERFKNEAKVMVALNHPNIRQVFDYAECDGQPAIIMEYLDGCDIKACLKKGAKLTQSDLEKLWNQCVDALNYTHSKGVVHRDIKPSNIFIDNDGNVKLLDFGIAKIKDTVSATQTGQKMGTLLYMSPEQVRDSKNISFKSDNYSLAVTFVNILSGKLPYDENTTSDYDIMDKIVRESLDMRNVPENWISFLEPYLMKNPNDRPELVHFGTSKGKSETNHSEETIIETSNVNTQEKKGITMENPNVATPKKNKNWLWILIGIVVICGIVLGIYLSNAKKKAADTSCFNSCSTISDFRSYLINHPDGQYKELAENNIQNLIADSIAEYERKTFNGHDYVDLGLPSGLLWATCNVGANSPEDYGSYFAFGETTTKDVYNEDTYKLKKNTSISNGVVKTTYSDAKSGKSIIDDYSNTLLPAYDAAQTNWGGVWRMPTKEEFDELNEKCSWTWMENEKMKGYSVTGPNGNSIFIPAAGTNFSTVRYLGETGVYRSSSICADCNGIIVTLSFYGPSSEFYKFGIEVECINAFWGGFSIRPVCLPQK